MRAWVKRIVIPIIIGFTIIGLILLASYIFIQTQMPRVGMRVINNTIMISIGNSTITMRAQANDLLPTLKGEGSPRSQGLPPFEWGLLGYAPQ
jgi:hypothetical protein